MKNRLNNFILSYLRYWAKVKLARQHAWIIGVTGSVGKSSFLSVADHVLSSVYVTKVTRKGNSESGLPLEILSLRDMVSDYSLFSWIRVLFLAPIYAFMRESWNLLIAELGIDSPFSPKNMEY
jgi:hypothetical protein